MGDRRTPTSGPHAAVLTTGTVAALITLTTLRLLGSEPRPIAGQPARSAEGVSLLLNAQDRKPVALLQDPHQRLPVADPRPLILQTEQDSPAWSGLPALRVADTLPAFWVQPASWNHFLKGPGAFAGSGREAPSRDWAGRPATDYRAYPLDTGLPPRDTTAAYNPAGPGRLDLALQPGAFSLAWAGVAGRVYVLEHTADLSSPFRIVRTFIQSDDAPVSLSLTNAGPAGFYRVSELPP